MCSHIFWIKFVNSGHSVSMFSQRKPSPPSHIAVNYTFHYCRFFQILSKNYEVIYVFEYPAIFPLCCNTLFSAPKITDQEFQMCLSIETSNWCKKNPIYCYFASDAMMRLWCLNVLGKDKNFCTALKCFRYSSQS